MKNENVKDHRKLRLLPIDAVERVSPEDVEGRQQPEPVRNGIVILVVGHGIKVPVVIRQHNEVESR